MFDAWPEVLEKRIDSPETENTALKTGFLRLEQRVTALEELAAKRV
jgi:hypothetical protein